MERVLLILRALNEIFIPSVTLLIKRLITDTPIDFILRCDILRKKDQIVAEK